MCDLRDVQGRAIVDIIPAPLSDGWCGETVDPREFDKIVLPRLRVQHPGNALCPKKAPTAKEIAAWVDHSEDNLLVLCDVHHRAQYFGIHEITYPVWAAQESLKGDFDKIARREVGAGDVATTAHSAE